MISCKCVRQVHKPSASCLGATAGAVPGYGADQGLRRYEIPVQLNAIPRSRSRLASKLPGNLPLRPRDSGYLLRRKTGIYDMPHMSLAGLAAAIECRQGADCTCMHIAACGSNSQLYRRVIAGPRLVAAACPAARAQPRDPGPSPPAGPAARAQLRDPHGAGLAGRSARSAAQRLGRLPVRGPAGSGRLRRPGPLVRGAASSSGLAVRGRERPSRTRFSLTNVDISRVRCGRFGRNGQRAALLA